MNPDKEFKAVDFCHDTFTRRADELKAKFEEKLSLVDSNPDYCRKRAEKVFNEI
mgnify:CR=1 FL=1